MKEKDEGKCSIKGRKQRYKKDKQMKVSKGKRERNKGKTEKENKWSKK